MTMETLMFDTLGPLVGGKVYPLMAPDDVGNGPYIVWHAAGGQATNFMDGGQPSKKNARIQVSVWTTTTIAAALLAQQAETALRTRAELSTTVLTGQFQQRDEETKRHGMYQFFSCWADISA